MIHPRAKFLYCRLPFPNGFLKRKNGVSYRNAIRNLSVANDAADRTDDDLGCKSLRDNSPITSFSEDECMTRDAARSWANSQLKPLVREMDDKECINPSILKQLFDNGFMAMVGTCIIFVEGTVFAHQVLHILCSINE